MGLTQKDTGLWSRFVLSMRHASAGSSIFPTSWFACGASYAVGQAREAGSKYGSEVVLDDLSCGARRTARWRDDPHGSGCGARVAAQAA